MNAQPPRDELRTARTLARLMDEAVGVPGTSLRFGLDSLLGLVPGAGDIAGGVVSGYLLLLAGRLGASRAVLGRMLLNIAVDTVVGTVPVLGDLFDVGWKANRRNLELLESHLASPAATRRASRRAVAAALAALATLVLGVLALAAWLIAALAAALG